MCPTSEPLLMAHPTWNAFSSSPEVFPRSSLNVTSIVNLPPKGTCVVILYLFSPKDINALIRLIVVFSVC